ncbi:Pumilio-family RNA-binding protein, putative [Theileria annulata]|uniref:Pumilio-family RNA-binding protein, putative n=1 Tax=Theileria annulata TaxID=5874 RepID=Q4UAG5_THEAN|nr:Pumilio-family RNA-binding protein, putative [Theileria annulata]CAI76186.1 Pumilio-family RNA-binding protein, putative [Theileria annulata]|eukprot:XP_952811.1 Pumilio-family RNA-binding protein, putative [Theileria annulata]
MEEKRDLCLLILTNMYIKSDFIKPCKDVVGSSVFQNSLNCMTSFNKFDEEFDKILLHITRKIEDQCLYELFYHSSGSHYLRTLILSLSNVHDRNQYFSKNNSFDDLKIGFEVPEWRRKLLFNWAEILFKDFKNLLQNTQASYTFCLLINVLKITNQLDKKFLMEIIKECIPVVKNVKNSSYILETCLKCSSNYEYTYIFNELISNDLQNLCVNNFANYVVQAFIENPHFQSSHLQYMIQNLNFVVLANSKSSSILWKLCKSCIDLYSCQELFYRKVFNDFKIEKNEEIWFGILSAGKTREEIFIKASGCSILGYLVKFQKSIISDLISSFKQFFKHVIDTGKFVEVTCDKHFSRVLQNMFDVRLGLVPEKFLKSLLGTFLTNSLKLSVDMNGCFVLYNYFLTLKPEDKFKVLTKIVQDYDEIKLKSPKYAKLMNLSEFKSNPKLFQKKMEKSESVRELFKDIVKTH